MRNQKKESAPIRQDVCALKAQLGEPSVILTRASALMWCVAAVVMVALALAVWLWAVPTAEHALEIAKAMEAAA